MYQRKERVDKSGHGHQDEVHDLFNLLESSDPEAVESVKNMIHENLSGTKDSRFLYILLDYYLAVQSKRSLDILLRVKDPHDKHLFDKINELMKNESTRYQALQLLCNLVYNQPSWLHRIANHKVISTLLQVLKTDISAPNLMSGIFCLICLLPMIPSQFGPFLNETFDIFSRLAAWNVRKPNSVQDIYMLHLQVGVYSLFHHLYGMFPCNFLAYLRSYYGGRDSNEETFRIFSLVIKIITYSRIWLPSIHMPLLECVRLHPLLVTASKETELSPSRWKKMAYHDIIVDCASVFIDSSEGSLEGLRQKKQPFDSVAFGQSSTSNQDTINLESLSCRSNSLSMNVDSGSLVKVAMNSNEDTMWSPSQACGFSTPSEASSAISPAPIKSEWEAKSCNTQLSMESNVLLDFAVEAKPEVWKEEHGGSVIHEKEKAVPKIISKDFKNIETDHDLSTEDPTVSKHIESKEKTANTHCNESFEQESILPGVEAKEDDLDKEVCDLTSNQNSPEKSNDVEARQNTPFCCTTQNLTDEPDNLHKTETSSSTRPNSLTKSNTSEDNDEMPSLQDIDMDAFVPTFSRYRYFSHCGPPPDIPSQVIRRKTYRSRSCPANFCPTVLPSPSIALTGNECSKSDATQPSSCNEDATSTYVSLNESSSVISKDRIATYNDLIPMALNFLSNANKPGDFSSNYCNRNSFLNTLSPPGLLDHYIQLGSVTYLSHLNSIPITSTINTDWTHFGGKAPPDEIAILRNQILLLHNQLLFERHRKNVHSERNRRILGRAKKCKMQEENIVALKQKISLLEKDNQDLKNELAYQLKLYQQLKTEKQQTENELNSHITKISQENSQLLFSNKKLQSLLVCQKQENDEIREEYKKCQSEVLNLRVELNLCHNEMVQCQNLEKDAVFLSKQLILLQELNSRYKEKIEMMKEPPIPDIELDLLQEASVMEIR
ncbi:hamartin-like, partial [Stegodyphus dumicola]|uniref:hamartin-like n=1 Tax=Stegodyphus dumicola TaxID=202533 RepID=UPI0015B1EEA9